VLILSDCGGDGLSCLAVKMFGCEICVRHLIKIIVSLSLNGEKSSHKSAKKPYVEISVKMIHDREAQN
jgi:hypothetical protein